MEVYVCFTQSKGLQQIMFADKEKNKELTNISNWLWNNERSMCARCVIMMFTE